MEIFTKKSDLIRLLNDFREINRYSVGFVPTMGFLHKGHASLIEKSASENNITVCSIFVNPLQFNDKNDFVSYPKNIDKDTELCKKMNCDIVYIPEYEDIYQENHKASVYDFGLLDKVLEGFYRPGHFQGVAEVVKILLQIIKPERAYFGEKDYQQLIIIKELVKQLKLDVDIVACQTVRETNGLAMSSRNSLIKKEFIPYLSFIWEQLNWCAENYTNYSPFTLKKIIEQKFEEHPFFELQYVEIADRNSLNKIDEWKQSDNIGVFIAAFLNEIRLIDNIRLK